MEYNFEDIRPLKDAEVPPTIARLAESKEARAVYSLITGPELPWREFMTLLRPIDNLQDFKREVFVQVAGRALKRSSFSLDLSGTSRLGGDRPVTYISNHRDIVLDPVLLNLSLIRRGYGMCQIGIGDNLLKRPWIELMVRAVGSYIVKRSVSMREMISESTKLSAYIHDALYEQKESVWIAQREGRAKDSNDRTQSSVLKMLTMAGKGTFLDRIRTLHLVPTALSYEYDPCDFLKAREMQAKRDQPDYTKSPQEDLVNMRTGMTGYKGRIHFDIGTPLNELLYRVDPSAPQQQQVACVAQLIDEEIHRRYRLYPANYIALDLLNQSDEYKAMYSDQERTAFIEYIFGRVSMIKFEDGISKDEAFLRQKLLEMYANPARNQLALLSPSIG